MDSASAKKIRDHPRVCGEHFPQTRIDDFKQGSSPRMRGTRLYWPWRFGASGIIPAYAGNTFLPAPSSALAWDHPRVCGEHPSDFVGADGVWGSSPRMRGTLTRRRFFSVRRGIIPAYAGNTRSGYPPRGVGGGSSPRMRGTLSNALPVAVLTGIIPAYAGNTCVF